MSVPVAPIVKYVSPDGRLTSEGLRLFQAITSQIDENTSSIAALPTGSSGISEYMVPIWAEENSGIASGTHEWAFGNGANTPSNNGISIYVPSGMECHIVAMGATTNNASGTATVEAHVNGANLGLSDGVEVTLAGRSGINDSFTAYALSNADRLNFRTRLGGVNSSPNTAVAWLRFRET